ncbi:hypothetical protein [Lactobacillus gallinarum]|uniref:hypothetical protein n=1 Tax=Lactobacillus gallinarum TaxID=52242 RepID=UPI00248E1B89|nr:hypothetical protein [Lactobacillus gallinarum]
MNKIDELVNHVKKADAIIVGAGSGMSNAAGMAFWYSASPLFIKHMKYFYDKYLKVSSMAFILNLIPKKSIGLLCLNL